MSVSDIEVTATASNNYTRSAVIYSNPDGIPEFGVSLREEPLNVQPGDTVTLTAIYEGRTVTGSFTARPGTMQFDIVFPSSSAISNTNVDAMPIATISYVNPKDVYHTEDISLGGRGADPDSTNEIVAYRWMHEETILSTEASFEWEAAFLPLGTQTIIFQVQDNEGNWSAPVEQNVYIRERESGAIGNTAPVVTVEATPVVTPVDKMPVATINYANPKDVYQSESISLGGHGSDPDNTDEIVAYRWMHEETILSIEASFELSAAHLPLGVQTIIFQVQDNEGNWSAPIEENVYIRSIETGSIVTPDATWTLFVYAMGDNDLALYMGDSLESGMLSRLKNLQGDAQLGVQVVVMYDGPGIGDSFYYVLSEAGGWLTVPMEEVRTDDPDTLTNFLKWGFETYGNSDYYALSILGHASGLVGLGPDTSSGLSANLEPNEIRDAIRKSSDYGHLNVVQFDGCSFGLFENTSIVDGYADYVVASPNTSWGIFAYDVYRGLAGESSSPADYAHKVAKHYADKLTSLAYPHTISVFDMAYFNAVKTSTDELGSALSDYIAVDPTARQQEMRDIRSTVQIYDSNDYHLNEKEDSYVDLMNFAHAVTAIADENIVTAANNVKTTLASLIAYHRSRSGHFYNDLIHTTISINLDNAHGIGIFYPYSKEQASSAWDAYLNDDLFRNLTRNWGWKDFLASGIPSQGAFSVGIPLPDDICSIVDEIPTAECEALRALYESTDGPNWLNNDGWLHVTNPCHWHGVTCEDGRVTQLKLAANHLLGSIPSEIGALTHLQVLSLRDNLLMSELPHTLTGLTNLTKFLVNKTYMCMPVDESFQNWLTGLDDSRLTQQDCPSVLIDTHVSYNTAENIRAGSLLSYTIVLTTSTPIEYVELYSTVPQGITVGVGYERGIPEAGTYMFEHEFAIDHIVTPGSILYSQTVLTGTDITVPSEDIVAVAVPDTNFTQTLVLLYAVGDNDLVTATISLLDKAAAQAHNPNVKVLLMLDGPQSHDSYVYQIQPDASGQCSLNTVSNFDHTCNGLYTEGQNMWRWTDNTATADSLENYVSAGMLAYPNAKQVVLSLIGHGNGWGANVVQASKYKFWRDMSGHLGGMLWDENPSNSLSTKEIGNALKNAYQRTSRKIDLLFFDACSMNMIEVIHELHSVVHYVFGSENLTWSALPYDHYLGVIDETMDARIIGQRWLDILSAKFGDTYPFAHSLIDVSQWSQLITKVDDLAEALIGTLPTYVEEIQEARRQTDCFDSDYNKTIDDHDNYCDLGRFVEALIAQFEAKDANVVTAATHVMETLTNAIVVHHDFHSGMVPNTEPPETWQWDNVYGLSIYLPILRDEHKRLFYNKLLLQFAQDSLWDEFLTAYWQEQGIVVQSASENSSARQLINTCEDTYHCEGLGRPLPMSVPVEEIHHLFLPTIRR
ncbi:MAG: clostripain-related cysteine peptidase [Chloroflexota bacterium]